ncbi:hypothetical protein KJ713_00860 [Patescibacteria group bacterium]|nr:hypothetical protein [Patescibacteria group bacterium]
MKKISLFLEMITEVFRDRIFIFLVLANLAVLGLIWFFWLTKISPSGYQVYTQFYLSSPRLLETKSFLPPLLASIIVFINFVLAVFSRKREALASYLLVGSSLFVLSLTLVLVRHYLSLI